MSYPYRLAIALVTCALILPGCKRKTGTSDAASDTRRHPRKVAKTTRSGPGKRKSAPGAGKTRQLARGETISSAWGAKMKVPARWYVTRTPSHIRFEDPDRELKMLLVEAKAKSGKEAIGAAWKRVRPGFSLKVKRAISPPPEPGWDGVTRIQYVTPSKSRLMVSAIARGKAGRWFVTLFDGKIAALSRRGAQLRTIFSSLEAPGVVKESFAGRKAHHLDLARADKLDRFTEMARRRLRVPGAAVAVVQDGRITYHRGFGHKRLGGKEKVTLKTLFMIGSMTKSLTSMMMAKLVDEGRLDWKAPVTKVLPQFALGDPAITRQCRVWHTVCACTGLPRQDMEFIFEYKKGDAADKLKVLSTMKPTTRFGETFQYSNVLVSAGGWAAAHAAYPQLELGAAYERAMKSRLFDLAGMTHTTFDPARVRRTDHAMPHAPDLREVPVAMPLSSEDAVLSAGPAGAAWSNVDDVARFLLLELGRGKIGKGPRIVSAKNVEERWKPRVRISDRMHYGLALMIDRTKKIRAIGHGGGTLGFTSYMFFLPEHDAGLVVLSNRGAGGRFVHGVRRRFLELLFDAKEQAVKDLDFAVKNIAKRVRKRMERVTLRPKAAWVKRFVGRYHSKALGSGEVLLKGGRGIFDAGEWQTPIAKRVERDGVEKLVTGPPLAGLELIPSKRAGKRVLTLHTGQQRYEFVER